MNLEQLVDELKWLLNHELRGECIIKPLEDGFRLERWFAKKEIYLQGKGIRIRLDIEELG